MTETQRANDLCRAELQAMLNRRYGTRHVRYDLDLVRELGARHDAYVALQQLAGEFPGEIDLEMARRKPDAYLRMLDRITATRVAEMEQEVK